MQNTLVIQPEAPFMEGTHELNSTSWGIHFRPQFEESRTRWDAEAAVHTVKKALEFEETRVSRNSAVTLRGGALDRSFVAWLRIFRFSRFNKTLRLELLQRVSVK